MDNKRLKHLLLKDVQDLGEQIGKGAYCTVTKMKFRGLTCAGKKFHNILVEDVSEEEKRALLERFADECELLSRLHHPNIIQFLGVHETNQGIPILVMEYMEKSLTKLVEDEGPVSPSPAIRILRDVAVGLAYLHGHSPPIAHRDLSANNVLLTVGMRAKIADLGVARILNITPSTTAKMTMCPGTQTYMPPEALYQGLSYDVGIDCFSFGVLIIHVLSGQWPYPSPPIRINPVTSALEAVSEYDRREKYIQGVLPKDHPLLMLGRNCLSNDLRMRPQMEDVLKELEKCLQEKDAQCCQDERKGLVELEARQLETSNLQKQVKELQDTRISLEIQLGELHSEKTELAEHNAHLVEACDPNNLSKVIQELELVLDEKEILERELKSTQDNLALHQERNLKLQEQLEKTSYPQELTQIQQRMQRYKLERESAKKELEIAREEIMGKHQEVEKLEQIIEELKGEKRKYQEKEMGRSQRFGWDQPIIQRGGASGGHPGEVTGIRLGDPEEDHKEPAKALCPTPGCSFYGIEEFGGYCKNSYTEQRRKSLRALCPTPGCSYYQIEEFGGFCKNCYTNQRRKPVKALCPTPWCSFYGIEEFGGYCKNCYIEQRRKTEQRRKPLRALCPTPGCSYYQIEEFGGYCKNCYTDQRRKPVKTLCPTPGCSFYGVEEFGGYCKNCYTEQRRKTEQRTKPLRALCPTPGCSYYQKEEFGGYCKNCYTDQRRKSM